MAESSNGNGKPKTKLLDELEKGPWPSFVKEIKAACDGSDSPNDLLGQLELSYEEKKGHWKHGGIVGVSGLRRRRHRPLQRRSGAVPEGRALPHHAREPARRMVLHQRGSAHALRYLGEARLRAHQHARLDRRHRSAGHHDRPTGAHLPGAGRKPASTWAARGPPCARLPAAWAWRAASGRATTP